MTMLLGRRVPTDRSVALVVLAEVAAECRAEGYRLCDELWTVAANDARADELLARLDDVVGQVRLAEGLMAPLLGDEK